MKNSQSAVVQALHSKALDASRRYREAERELITLLQQIDDYRGYRDLGYKSLFDYAHLGLQLTDAVSFTFISLARKSREIPQLKKKIDEGRLSISNARMVAPILSPANQKEWLKKAEDLSKRELEREIKSQFPERAVIEQTRFVAPQRMELKVGISEELNDKLRRVQDLMSQKMGRAASLEESIEAMAEAFLEKHDPVRKAERSLERHERKLADQAQKPAPGQVEATRTQVRRPAKPNLRGSTPGQPRDRIPLNAKELHQVHLRDGNRCTEIESVTGRRCEQRRWLEVHHIVPVAHGGSNHPDNLRTVCRAHHQLLHAKDSPTNSDHGKIFPPPGFHAAALRF